MAPVTVRLDSERIFVKPKFNTLTPWAREHHIGGFEVAMHDIERVALLRR
jgi:hypothetical protein